MTGAVATAVVVVLVLSDQVTKFLVRQGLSFHETITLAPFLNIVHVENRGAAFGMFADLSNVFFITVGGIAGMVIVGLMIKARRERFPLALLLGGAVGNLIDRVLFGTVTDFIDVHVGAYHWPAFNVADSALTLGVAVMLATELFQVRRPAEVRP